MLNYLSLFSGIGAFESALSNLGVKYEVVNYSEIDKYASKSYSAIHDITEDKNLGDITKIDTSQLPNDIDLITYGFPCQDISSAGKQKGMFNKDETPTRSGLFFEALRIIEETKPKIAIAENVKNLTCKKFKNQFDIVLNSLENAGYNNYWQILNAKDYGIPQNRERIFIVSIRKDMDNGKFEFPKPFELKKKLRDFLEVYVDEKYFLTDAQLKRMKATRLKQQTFKHRVTDENGICQTLCASNCNDAKCVQIGQLYGTGKEPNPQAGRIYSSDGLSPTIDTCGGGNRMPKVEEKSKIRKLTPKECFRLMGFTDDEYARAEKFNSNTQLYKQAGNSIVVDVLVEIFRMMLDKHGEIYI